MWFITRICAHFRWPDSDRNRKAGCLYLDFDVCITVSLWVMGDHLWAHSFSSKKETLTYIILTTSNAVYQPDEWPFLLECLIIVHWDFSLLIQGKIWTVSDHERHHEFWGGRKHKSGPFKPCFSEITRCHNAAQSSSLVPRTQKSYGLFT